MGAKGTPEEGALGRCLDTWSVHSGEEMRGQLAASGPRYQRGNGTLFTSLGAQEWLWGTVGWQPGRRGQRAFAG